MNALIVASSEPCAGRSTIAAAIAYRLGRDGRAVTLARLAGDDSSSPDAAAFSALEGVIAAPQTIENAALSTISGDIIIETPPGPVEALAQQLSAQVVVVTGPSSPTLVVASARLAGIIVTGVPASELATVSQRLGALAVIPEDRTLAAPSVADIAAALKAKWLAEGEPASASIGRVMIGTVSSDAAAPYFGNRANTCVVTRYDKTDIQLAALNTGLQCLVLTGGGEPSPYLLDRVVGHRPDVAVLLADGNTVDTVHAIEPLFGKSRFSGQGKLDRIVALLDEANVNIAL
jgi:BioD-like phosphotransacetylase family protein